MLWYNPRGTGVGCRDSLFLLFSEGAPMVWAIVRGRDYYFLALFASPLPHGISLAHKKGRAFGFGYLHRPFADRHIPSGYVFRSFFSPSPRFPMTIVSIIDGAHRWLPFSRSSVAKCTKATVGIPSAIAFAPFAEVERISRSSSAPPTRVTFTTHVFFKSTAINRPFCSSRASRGSRGTPTRHASSCSSRRGC